MLLKMNKYCYENLSAQPGAVLESMWFSWTGVREAIASPSLYRK